MNHLKTKASRFFKDSPNQDEQAANAEFSNLNADFDAGIVVTGGRGGDSGGGGGGAAMMKKKPSRFFQKKENGTPPDPPPPSGYLVDSLRAATATEKGNKVKNPTAGKYKDLLEAQEEFKAELNRKKAEEDANLKKTKKDTNPKKPKEESVTEKPKEQADTRKPSSFATLKSKSSRIFKRAPSPPPPVPTRPIISNPIPINSHAPSYTVSVSSKGHVSSTTHRYHYRPPTPAPEFTRPIAPAPARPERPDSLDAEIVAFIKDTTARTALGNSPHNTGPTGGSKGNVGVDRAHGATLARANIEGRLGLPSGLSPSSPTQPSPLGRPSIDGRFNLPSGMASSSPIVPSPLGRTFPPASPSANFNVNTLDTVADRGSGQSCLLAESMRTSSSSRPDTLRWSERHGRENMNVYRPSMEGKLEVVQRVHPKRTSGGGWTKGATLYKDEKGFRHLIEDM